MTREEKVLQLKQDFDEVYDAGKKAECDAFWKTFQGGGSRFSYNFAFCGLYDSSLHYGWNDATYNPIYPIKFGNESSNFTHYGQQAFYYNTEITDTKVDILVYVSELQNTFANAYNLKTIRKIKLMRDNVKFNGVFTKCLSLENIVIEGVIGQNGLDLQWSTKLSRESIESIINALSDTTSGLSITLSQNAVDVAFQNYNNEGNGLADGSASNAWEALIATKPNWAINLV
jgi:hypothetical protein